MKITYVIERRPISPEQTLLGAQESDHSVQVAAVQTWLNEGHAVSPLLRISLESRHLPLDATRRAA